MCKHALLWLIKGGNGILQVDDERERVLLQGETWKSWAILQMVAEYGLACYGYVLPYGSEDRVTYDWALDTPELHLVVEHQHQQRMQAAPTEEGVAASGCVLGGSLGHVNSVGVPHQLTPVPTTLAIVHCTSPQEQHAGT